MKGTDAVVFGQWSVRIQIVQNTGSGVSLIVPILHRHQVMIFGLLSISYWAKQVCFSGAGCLHTPYVFDAWSCVTLMRQVLNCMRLQAIAQIALLFLFCWFSEHHFYGPQHANARMPWLLHSLLLVSCHPRRYGNQSSFHCCTRRKSPRVTVAAKLLKMTG